MPGRRGHQTLVSVSAAGTANANVEPGPSFLVAHKRPWCRSMTERLTDALIDVICESEVPYFDLSLQHVSKPLLRRMRRWGDGERYLDYSTGIGVTNTGHAHPRVVEAVQRQIEDFTHTCFMVTPYEEYVAVCEKLAELTPGKDEKRSALFNSGAYVGAMSLIMATGKPLQKYIPEFSWLLDGVVTKGFGRGKLYETAAIDPEGLPPRFTPVTM